MNMVKEITTIKVERDVHKDLMIFKIRTNAVSLNDVLKLMIKKLKEELENDNQL